MPRPRPLSCGPHALTEERDAAAEIAEQDRLKFAREAHRKGRWDEAHFGVAAKAVVKPRTRSTAGRLALLLGVLLLAGGGVVAADWFGAVDLGIRPVLGSLGVPLGDQEPVGADGLVDAAVESRSASAQPAGSSGGATPVASASSASTTAAPLATAAAPSPERVAAAQRAVEVLGKQLAEADAEVRRHLAKLAAAEEKGPDNLTYEQRLNRDLRLARANGNSSSAAELEQAMVLYQARKNEVQTKLDHARSVLTSIQKRLAAARAGDLEL